MVEEIGHESLKLDVISEVKRQMTQEMIMT